MKNEGIDVEKIGSVCGRICDDVKKEIIALCTRIRAATEAEVTKREREKVTQLVQGINNNHAWIVYGDNSRPVHAKPCWACNVLAAYESNDAGEKKT